ncbi:MAG: hypothetical protein ABGX22_26655 [Pirellulaceae bacterium]|nr:hypothetical protein [Planctomycetaceae bacterium]
MTLPLHAPGGLGFVAAVSIAIVIGDSLTVRANAGPTTTALTVVAEPVGIKDVRIAHETLTIDLRPVATGGMAKVKATYELRNDGGEQELDLLFAFGSLDNSDCVVTLNEKSIFGTLKKTPMPKDWMPPAVTPGLAGTVALSYGGGWSSVIPLLFSIVLPSGPSKLTVSYRAGVKHTFARPAMFRQFAYMLAPARSWAGFGRLDLKIHTPRGWSVATTPKLQQVGALLKGTFDDVPADAIAVTLRPPVASSYQTVKNASRLFFVLIGISGAAVCWRAGGAKSGRDFLNFVRSAGIGLAYGIVVFISGMIATWGPDQIFPMTAAERLLVDSLGLSDGYATLAAMAGVLLSSLAASTVGCVIVQARPAPRA